MLSIYNLMKMTPKNKSKFNKKMLNFEKMKNFRTRIKMATILHKSKTKKQGINLLMNSKILI
jgi:hypothetical protein